MSVTRILITVLMVGAIIGGCSQQEDPLTPPENSRHIPNDKDGTEMLGETPVPDGSGFVEGGVGMVGVDSGTLDIMVPDGATVEKVFLYWVGGSTDGIGDSEIEVDGNPVTGSLIGGPTNFYENMFFTAWRADITGEGWVVPGANSFTISGFDFDFTGNTHDENNGAGMLVVYDDGTEAELELHDGLDMAFFSFSPTLDATAPITFDFAAEPADRMAQFVVLAGSVGENRPNMIKVTTSAGEQTFDDPLGSNDGLLFDSITLDVLIPAGDTSLTAQLFSVVSDDPLGASMGWIGTGLGVPVTPLYCIGDYVWYDENKDGCQDEGELGAEGVEVNLWVGCPPVEVIATTTTDADGNYLFCDLEPGDYTVQFVAPDGYEFCEPFSSACGTDLDSNAGADGITDCVTIVDQDDLTIDAALCAPPPPTYCLGDFVWYDDDKDGCQDPDEMGAPGVEVNLWVGCPPVEVIGTTVTGPDGEYQFCELEPGDYTVQFVAPDGYEFCEPFSSACGTDKDSNAGADGITDCVTIVDQDDWTIDAALCLPEEEGIGCRMTGGGNSTFDTGEGMIDVYTFGGQAGAPLASQPQPWGNWTHHQKNGPSGSFVFHAGTPSAPEGTEIDWITCMDPGWCVQARNAPAKQLDFGGVGTFKNMKGAPAGIADNVMVGDSLHWFEVNVDDLGEPGGHAEPEGCDPLGYGRNGGAELADCGCPDFYRIKIYSGPTDASEVMYEVYGYIDHGNLQLHPPTGRDRGNWY